MKTMRIRGNGYSYHQFDHGSLRAIAQRIAETLPKLLAEYDAQAVVVTGKSGMSVAFAAMMLADIPLIVVRKRGENAHGEMIEGVTSVEVRRYIILDDFVSSGATVRTVVRDIDDYCRVQCYARPEPVAVACYLSGGGTVAARYDENAEVDFIPRVSI
jgi:orotate phosphoribosyltransferase-like protein